MAVEVELENGLGEVVAEWPDWRLPWDQFFIDKPESIVKTYCLRFIDQFGDTVFNRLQLPILIAELETVSKQVEEQDERQGIESLIGFVRKAEKEQLYVRFIGD